MKRTTDSARDEKILSLARAGFTYQEIASAFGLTTARVTQIAIGHGIHRRAEQRAERAARLHRLIAELTRQDGQVPA